MAMAANISHDGVPNWFFVSSAEKPTTTIRVDRESTVLPASQSHRHNINLSSLDLTMLKLQYDQKGLFYEMPAHRISSAVDLLEKSLSRVLVDFYPLAGRLSTSPSDGQISIDCNDAGAAFIEASAENVYLADLTTAEVTSTVHQLFSLNGVLNVEGHRLPLLAVQVTKLRDGMFIGCSVNHCLVDGISLWHFFNSWAEICRGAQSVSVNPIHDRCLSSAKREPVQLNLDPDAGLKRSPPPLLRVKMFYFSKAMIQGLKDRTNRELPLSSAVSSLQALLGHVWQAIVKARRFEPQYSTEFRQSVDCRRRLAPSLPSSSFGNFVQGITTISTVGEMESNDMSYPAQLLQRTIRGHGNTSIMARIDEWETKRTPVTLENLRQIKNSLLLGSSPRFKMYETNFGWGKPVAARSGCSNKGDGKMAAYPGKEGDGSVVLEICLAPDTMDALEMDQQFVNPRFA